MAKGKGEIQGWITKNGVHIPIYGHYSVRGGEEPKAKGAKWGKDKQVAGKGAVKDVQGKKPSMSEEEKKPTSFQEQVNDRFKTKREWDEIAKNAGYKDSSDPEFQKNADDIVAKNKQAAKDEKEAKTIAGIAGLYQAEKQEQESSKAFRDKKAQEQGFASAKDMESYNEETGVNKETWKGQESSTSKPNKTDAYNDKVFADFKKNGKDYQRVPMEGYAGTANDFKAAAKRAGVEIEYDKGDDTFYLRKSKQDSLSAGTNERSRIRGELHAKDKAMKAAMPTTVSGLRSAYADATGSMKSKIAAELRRKGYSLIGGKWVKGK